MKKEKISAVEAQFEAQKIAFGPLLFKSILAMRDLGILQFIYRKRGSAQIEDIITETGLSKYSVDVMLEAAEVLDVVNIENGKIEVTKIGFYLLRDELTRVNIDFVNDVCYEGAHYMEESLVENRPAGLKVFGDWSTVYEGLAHLDPLIRKSWLEFDHFYSQGAFDAALKIVFCEKPRQIFDIGGNTGKWALKCCEYNHDVSIKILDLPGQLEMAKENVTKKGFIDRVSFHPINVLDTSMKIPQGADVIWMSQFLDCFSEEEVSVILNNCYQAADHDTVVYIMEPYIDNQNYPAAELSLVGTSLYFTSIANGNSKMFKITVMRNLIEKAGLEIVEEFALIANSFHTILKCKKKNL